jgi:hypothetical protein
MMRVAIEIFGYSCFAIAIVIASFYPIYLSYREDKKKKDNGYQLKIGGSAKLM